MEINKELLKGHIEIILLSILSRREMYGYEIFKLVKEIGPERFEIKEGTLYLNLNRMEKRGYIISSWGNDQGSGGRRKYYILTSIGLEFYKQKRMEWNYLKSIIDTYILLQ